MDRLVFIAHNVGGTGGTEQQVARMVQAAVNAGWHVTVVARTCDLPEMVRVDWIRVRTPRRPTPIAYVTFALSSWLTSRNARRGAVVHVSNAWSLVYADFRTIHFCHAAYKRKVGTLRVTKNNFVYRMNARLAQALNVLMERLAYRKSRTRTFIAVSSGLAGELADVFGIDPSSIRIIPNGVDLERFQPDAILREETRAKLGFADSTKVALFVGGDWMRKGVRPLVSALTTAPGWSLVVVGAGDINALSDHASAEGVLERLDIVGTSSEPWQFFAAADVFVLPSAYETFGMAVMEAMASGLPILAAPSNGISEFLAVPDMGLFISQDPDSIAAGLNALGDETVRSEIGTRARERAAEYSWDRVGREYETLFAEAK